MHICRGLTKPQLPFVSVGASVDTMYKVGPACDTFLSLLDGLEGGAQWLRMEVHEDIFVLDQV